MFQQQFIPKSITNVVDHGIEYVATFEPFLSKTTVLVPSFLGEWDLQGDEKLLLTLFLGYPLGVIMAVLPFGLVKHIYAFLSGLMLLQWTAGPWWIYNFTSSLIIYGIMWICTTKKKQKQYYIYMKYTVCIFSLTFVSIQHCYKMYNTTHHTSFAEFAIYFQMAATQKVYRLVYNIYDGYILAMKKTKNHPEDTTTSNNSSSDDDKSNIATKSDKDLEVAMKLKQYALKDGNIPNLIEYLGYIFCFSTLSTFEFSVYRNACNGSLFDIPTKVVAEEDGTTSTVVVRKKPPSNIVPTLKPLSQSIGLLCAHAFIHRYYDYKMVLDATFGQKPFLYRLYYEYMAGMPYRFDFYLPWKLNEGSTNLWYGGFDGYDETTGKAKGWTNSWGVDIYCLELSACAQLWTKRWNIKTSEWLKRYVYYRCNGNLFFTYFISALWHGFYLMYYLIAIAFVIFTYCERIGRRKITPHFIYPHAPRWKKVVYQALSIFLYHFLVLYLLYPFKFKTLENTIAFWKAHYFLGHIAFLIYLLVVPFLPDPPKTTMANNTRVNKVNNSTTSKMMKKVQ